MENTEAMDNMLAYQGPMEINRNAPKEKIKVQDNSQGHKARMEESATKRGKAKTEKPNGKKWKRLARKEGVKGTEAGC